MVKEKWEWVVGNPNYAVSTFGRVQRRCWIVREGRKCILRGGQEQKQAKSKFGYMRVAIFKQDGKGTVKHIPTHRLVAEAFIPNPENKPQVNHIDCVKSNNVVSNLEWCTGKENQQHALRNGRYKIAKGEMSHYAKLKDAEVVNIKNSRFFHKTSTKILANMYGVSGATIIRILNGTNWKHIPNPS
jgi:hypothetical protein